MKYAISYFNKSNQYFKYLDEVDEIIVRFSEKDTTLVDFMLAHVNQRVIIYVLDIDTFVQHNDIRLFEGIAEQHPEINFALEFEDYDDSVKPLIAECKSKGIKFFFNTYIRDFDKLWGFINLGVSDVYIVEELGFEIQQCAAAAHQYGVQIRVYPNVAQSSWPGTSAIMKFFIRPEDIKIYEPYVDVMEFFGSDKNLATYYKIYAKDQEWFGNLKEVIQGFEEDIDSRNLLPNFAKRRVNCGKGCLKGKPCKICAVQQGLAEVLSKNDLTLKQLRSNIHIETSDD